MPEMTVELQAKTLQFSARPLMGTAEDYDHLMELIGNARFMLIGEATHGTHEFYRERAEITKRLIREKRFNAVMVEADWPDAYRVNRYVRGQSDNLGPEQALAAFKCFPTWMWRNTVVCDFVGWLRHHNSQISANTDKVGFYGMDLYSLYTSIEAVLPYLDHVDPEAAKQACYRYGCFEDFEQDPQAYGYAANFGMSQSCENDVVAELVEMQRRALDYARRDGVLAEDEFFFAEQNARVVKNAERYYREMFRGQISSWNLRDQHMVEMLDALTAHLQSQTGRSKVVVWAHNSHLGDARTTQMGEQGELNVGQLVRQRFRGDCALIGMTTYSGTVTAARNWDQPAQRKRVRPAWRGSYEELFHLLRNKNPVLERFFLNVRDMTFMGEAWERPHLERAIGVIYRPETEHASHYFYAHLAEQFDAILHFDEMRTLEPLERTSEWGTGELPETYPTGL